MNATYKPDTEPYAIQLIKRDHRIIDELFTELAGAAPEQQAPLTQRISKLLAIHARIEERYLYPFTRQLASSVGHVEAAERAHGRAAKLLDAIAATPNEHQRRALLLELSENVRAHVNEEERELLSHLPDAHGSLDQLARELQNYKDILMQEEGLHEDDELNVRPAR
jgi:hemerythrin superfamily protein